MLSNPLAQGPHWQTIHDTCPQFYGLLPIAYQLFASSSLAFLAIQPLSSIRLAFSTGCQRNDGMSQSDQSCTYP